MPLRREGGVNGGMHSLLLCVTSCVCMCVPFLAHAVCFWTAPGVVS
jgi:hypothetical protein